MSKKTAKIIKIDSKKPVSDWRDQDFKFLFNELVADLQYWNIQSVAEAADVNQQTLYNWINRNVKFPSTRTFMRVAKALGYEIVLKRKNETIRRSN